MTDYGDKAKEEFYSEAQEIIDGLSRDFLLLDAAVQGGQQEPAVLNEVFRGVHTLKGLCGMFGETHMSAVAHEMESLLDSLRMGRISLDAHVVDLLFQGMEFLTELLVQSHEKGQTSDSKQLQAFLHELRTLVGQQQPDSGSTIAYRLDPSMLAVLTEYEEHRLRTALQRGMRLYRAHVNFDLENIDGGLDVIRQSVAPYGEIITYLPTADAAELDGISLDVLVACSISAAKLRQVLGEAVSSVEELPRLSSSVAASGENQSTGAPPDSSGMVTAPPPADHSVVRPPVPEIVMPPELTESSTRRESSDRPPRRTSWPPAVTQAGVPRRVSAAKAIDKPGPKAGSLRSVSQTVRVDIRRLDTLMNLVGELRLVSTELERLVETARDAATVELYRSMRQVHHRLDRQLSLLQNGILDVRMVPLAQVFEKLERVARQASRETGKRANLVITGADTEVDKLIGEDLADPLMHMIRNALAHGIEDEKRRREVGKPLEGTVAVNAYHRGNQVVVEVEDDGAGIDQDRLVQIAIERGFLSEEEASELSEQDKLALVFLPGMSTRSEGDTLSGRGVGMDVVKTNIGKLGGVVDLQSQRGIGTKFTITLPITLAMIRALLLRSTDQIYAVPLANVEEVIEYDEDKAEQIEGRPVLPLHGVSLPLCHLARMYGLEMRRRSGERGPGKVIVLAAASRKCGLVVDDIEGTQDIVIKPLTGALRSLPGFAGASELANNRLGLVIDVPGLLEQSLGSLVSVRNKDLEAL